MLARTCWNLHSPEVKMASDFLKSGSPEKLLITNNFHSHIFLKGRPDSTGSVLFFLRHESGSNASAAVDWPNSVRSL